MNGHAIGALTVLSDGFESLVQRQPDVGDDAYCEIQDLISDLLHLTHHYGWSTDDMVRRATQHFKDETNELASADPAPRGQGNRDGHPLAGRSSGPARDPKSGDRGVDHNPAVKRPGDNNYVLIFDIDAWIDDYLTVWALPRPKGEQLSFLRRWVRKILPQIPLGTRTPREAVERIMRLPTFRIDCVSYPLDHMAIQMINR